MGDLIIGAVGVVAIVWALLFWRATSDRRYEKWRRKW